MNKTDKILLASIEFNKLVGLNKFALAPLVIGGVAVSWATIIGITYMISGMAQGIAEALAQCDNLVDSAKEIIEQLTELNNDYGFGNIQSDADKLIANLKLMIDLYSSVSEPVSETEKDQNKLKNKYNDTVKFITALTESETQLQLVSSYLTENKGFGTKATEALRGIGLSFGLETDTISAIRAIGNFYTHVGATRIKLEQKLKSLVSKVEAEHGPLSQIKQQAPAHNDMQEDSEDDSFEDFEEMPESNNQRGSYKNAPSNLEEFADINF